MSEATVIALGFFDGVHLGHGALLRKTAERARELGVTPAAFTFDRSPKEFVTGVPVPLLTSAAERAEIIREYYGIGTVFVEAFDRAMMTMPWEDFITELLVKKYRAVHLVAGHDFRFGYKNQGDPEKLREKCRALGLGCDIIPKVELDGVTVSSTYIRSLVADIGEKLSCGAVMTALRRTKANGFPIDGCITLDELAELAQSGKIEEKIIPIEQALDSYRFVTVTEPQARRFKNGGELSLERLYLKAPQENELVRVIAPGNEFLGMGEVSDGEIKVKRLLIK